MNPEENDFAEQIDLASETMGGSVLFANDDFFAKKENLIKKAKPIFIDGKYTDRGKWMDGWESRRRRAPGHDYAIVRLGAPGIVSGVVVDTSHFRGNFPESCALEGADAPVTEDVETLDGKETTWFEILPRSPLRGDTQNRFVVNSKYRVTHLRFHIYPDGGVARLRVHGEVLLDPLWLEEPMASVDLAAAEHGGAVIAASDMFFGSRHNLIMPGAARDMGDGWETRRSRAPGPDWVILRLAARGTLRRAVVETAHFKGNAPESCALAVYTGEGAASERRHKHDAPTQHDAWLEILPRTKLMAHTRHLFRALAEHPPARFVRFQIYPDGGVSRLRLFGRVPHDERRRAAVRYLDALAPPRLEALLGAACASPAWVRSMINARPYEDFHAFERAAERAWLALAPDAWKHAFSAHPRIGARAIEGTPAREQIAVLASSDATKTALAQINAAYEARFGFIYIVCASGKTGDELLEIAKKRLENDAERELCVAAEEHHKITMLRLQRLLLGDDLGGISLL